MYKIKRRSDRARCWFGRIENRYLSPKRYAWASWRFRLRASWWCRTNASDRVNIKQSLTPTRGAASTETVSERLARRCGRQHTKTEAHASMAMMPSWRSNHHNASRIDRPGFFLVGARQKTLTPSAHRRRVRTFFFVGCCWVLLPPPSSPPALLAKNRRNDMLASAMGWGWRSNARGCSAVAECVRFKQSAKKKKYIALKIQVSQFFPLKMAVKLALLNVKRNAG
jgi:hypothetical protein